MPLQVKPWTTLWLKGTLCSANTVMTTTSEYEGCSDNHSVKSPKPRDHDRQVS